MPKPFAWSYSALSAFETCPRQYHEMRVLKRWPDPPGEAQQFGKLCHTYLENRINAGIELPVFLRHVEPVVARLESSPGALQAEYKYALDAQLQPVEFFAPTAWVRAVGDVVKIHEDRGFAMDWKSGKYREGDDQLRLQSNVMFGTYPHLQRISVMYVWLKDKRATTRVFDRADVPATWQAFLPRVQRMEHAAKTGDYPPKPSGLCRKYCRVKTCEFNGSQS
ncbi:PD-(D/E)XK nuclease family protein [Candidimonas nitroreducens]|nr:PD-(D/E)XK nuclease family protein [Candidimonas nitroreducens]